ncbi:PH domain-containing protein [Brachybacterium sacelli]|uniref:Membrane protein n=1 Tax=Brachybacterium sacelli TaxID=173364 RepID=A0ABS4X5C5_9MICO|nr:PH domain-containing protein [Brachybacterium sacelli]MBP2383662.1 putative membrane protein [Brachybacterium sacelli]
MSASAPIPAPDVPPASEQPWQRLDVRTILASVLVLAAVLLGIGVVVAIGMLLLGVGPGWVLLWVGGGVTVLSALVALVEWIRLRTTTYRLDGTRIERRVRFLGSSRTSLARDRIRNVELSADLFQRRLGIAEVKLATADGGGERFHLQALDRAVADALRIELLGERATAETGTLATIDWGWLRYAPVSLTTGAIGVAAYGAVFQVFDWFAAVPALIAWIAQTFGAFPLILLIPALILGAVVLGAVATLALYVEGWWGYRLGRHRDASLDLHRGLLVSRSTVFDGDRLRGLTLHEPLGLRRVGGARLDVIAVGVKAPEGDQKNAQSPALVPASPRAVGAGVAATVLGAALPEELSSHPPAARRKRFLRAGMLTAAGTVPAVIPALLRPSLWWIPVLTVLVLAALTAVLALDNARGLGHLVTERHVVLRKGSLFRRTDVMDREGVLGWNLTRSPFQRRSGLGTVVATSAGGSGAFHLPDVAAEQAREVMGSAGRVWEHLQVGAPAAGDVSAGAGRRPPSAGPGDAAPRDR